MTYEVVLTEAVQDAISAQIEYCRNEGVAPDVVSRWLSKLFTRVEGLYDMPLCFPIAALVSSVLGQEIRRLNHGEHALFYWVDEKALMVEIVAFRDGRQQPWSA